NAAEQAKHRVDDQEDSPYLVQLIDDRKTAETEVCQTLSHVRQHNRIGNADDCGLVAFCLTLAQRSALAREGQRHLTHWATMLDSPLMRRRQRNIDASAGQ